MFGWTRSTPSQSGVPAGLTPASDSGFCFQCQAGSSLVLRRPIEITALTGHVAIRGRLQTSLTTKGNLNLPSSLFCFAV
jgi:hypothetical protein